MIIIDADWTPRYNLLTIACSCGCRFQHRADRWKVTCPDCKRSENLAAIRERIIKEEMSNG